MNRSYYHRNRKYTEFLKSLDNSAFTKYAALVNSLCQNAHDSFLDVGCGTGQAIKKVKFTKKIGVEVSRTSFQHCQKQAIDCRIYDGYKLPFQTNRFSVVGSLNVFEHTDNPSNFLDECYRVCKKGGHLVLFTPNFLSLTNSYHYHTAGIKQKASNLFSLISRALSSRVIFDHMQPVIDRVFSPDDDATVLANPVDILKWARSRGLSVVYWSSRQVDGNPLADLLDRGPLRAVLGSCVFIFKK